MRCWRWRLLFLAAAVPALGTGCGSTNTDRGLVAGGILGATAGALLTRGRAGGALVGGALGAAAGGLTGAAVDNSERKMAARQAAMRPPLPLEKVVELTTSGLSDDVIITQIRNSGSVYNLQADHLVYLQQNGVREPVIRYMQATAGRPVPVYTAVPVAQPVYVYEPAPPPPIGFGVGVRIR